VRRHYGVPRLGIRVFPTGIDDSLADRPARRRSDARPRERPYILSVASLSPHKNASGLLEAFRIARERYALPHELHLVGMPGTGADLVARRLAAAAAAGLPVRAVGYVDEETLRAEYEDASLLVFVPLVEGFGLPPLEAMACGVPVVASNTSAVPEVCGDAALLVDPEDPGAVAEAMGRVLMDPALAARLRAAGLARAARFTWEAAALATRDTYECVAGGGSA